MKTARLPGPNDKTWDEEDRRSATDRLVGSAENGR